MKLNGLLVSLACLTVLALVSPTADAQRKSKMNVDVLDGTAVNIGQVGTATPVEKKLGENSNLAINYPPTKTIYLYPKGQNVDQGIVENGVAVTQGPLESNGEKGPEQINPSGFLTHVGDSARIDIYLPEKCNGQMVIICPGGGYGFVSLHNEGIYMAKWLNDRGIAGAVVKYRLPGGHSHIPLQDVQNAFRYCRHHAQEWGVSQIGVAGFSAGGHLAATVETMYVDAVTKPDFAILVYPVITMDDALTHKGSKSNLLGSPASWADRDAYSYDQWSRRQEEYAGLSDFFSPEKNVTAQTPPTFIATCNDDGTVHSFNSADMYLALQKNKVLTEMHIYSKGGHGWGFNDLSLGLDPTRCKDAISAYRPEFSSSLERWLSDLVEPDKKRPGPGNEKFSHNPDKVVFLYPEGQNVDKGIEGITLGPGESNGVTGAEVWNPGLRLTNVGDSARFDLYLADKPNGKLVVVCPGGGYSITAQLHEGAYVAEWLNSQGISAAVVKYRLPHGHWTIPLTDVQNTFRYCRHYAEEWGIEKIGVMGFSAGGHLAATASTLYTDPVTRPDFSILVYPVISSDLGVAHSGSFTNLLGSPEVWNDRSGLSYSEWAARQKEYKDLLEIYSPEKQVTADTPPAFVVFSSNDSVKPENGLRYYKALRSCGVTAEIHALPLGGHGWGFYNIKYGKDHLLPYRSDFLASMARFLQGL